MEKQLNVHRRSSSQMNSPQKKGFIKDLCNDKSNMLYSLQMHLKLPAIDESFFS